MADITPAKKLFDLLVSRDFDPETLNSSGKPAMDPTEAEIFSFDFRAESGKDYGTVVIMLSNNNEFDVYCTDNVGRTMESSDKDEWFAFLEQLKNFAVRNHYDSFGIKNLNHLRYSMQGQAAIKEGLFESWSGKRDISWNGNATEARLMIKHKRALDENEDRFRYVESLFIETAEGERYKLGFKNLTAGKAMLEHVRQGGKPYDVRGQHITGMVMEMSVLSRFRRANHGKLLKGDTVQLVEQTNVYYENLRHSLKSITTARGYNSYFESWNPTETTEQQLVIEGLKHLFVTQTIDPRIEDALPLLAKIQQQETAMKEANIFESWANTLMEGTWQLPDTPEKRNQLIKLLQKDLPVGADATNATEQLYDLLGDDHLFDQLEALAERDANADARQVIYDRLQELSDHPDVREVMDQLQVDATAEMNPPEATPADLDTPEEVDEDGQPVPPPTQPRKKWSMDPTPDQMPQGDRQRPNYFEELKDPRTQTEDPAGTQEPSYPEYASDLSTILKYAGVVPQDNPAPDYEEEIAEDELDDVKTIGGDKTDAFIDDISIKQDPQEWVAQNLESHLRGGGIMGGNPDEDYGIERESVMHGDYAEEKSRMRKMAGLTDEAVGEYDGKPTVEYRGIFYVKQPNGTWASLKGDHVAEPAVKQVLDKMQATNEAIVDPNSTVAIHNPETERFVDPKADADVNVAAKWADIAHAGDVGPQPGVHAWAAGYPNTNNSSSTSRTVNVSSSGSQPQQMPAKDMGKADVIDVEEDNDNINIDAKFANPQDEFGNPAKDSLGRTAQDIRAQAGLEKVKQASGLRPTLTPTGPYNTNKLGGPDMQPVLAKEESPLAGQYGHSGKMKAVSNDLSFLDRLKELSGMKK